MVQFQPNSVHNILLTFLYNDVQTNDIGQKSHLLPTIINSIWFIPVHKTSHNEYIKARPYTYSAFKVCLLFSKNCQNRVITLQASQTLNMLTWVLTADFLPKIVVVLKDIIEQWNLENVFFGQYLVLVLKVGKIKQLLPVDFMSELS